jgi:tetratricopeptide (TPR) repeat protein
LKGVPLLPAPSATAKLEVERTQRAIDQWLALRPHPADQAQGFVWRGRLHGLVGDYPAAVADLRRAFALDPDSYQTRWHLAETIVQESPIEAGVHLEALRRSYPDDPVVPLLLARVRRSTGQRPEAARLLEELIAANADNVPALIDRGVMALDDGDLAQAEHWLREAESRRPDHPQVLQALGRYLRLAGRPEQARSYELRFRQLEIDARPTPSGDLDPRATK